MKRMISFCFLAALPLSLLHAQAGEPGKHSPYVIGPVVRDQAKRQMVIPVHYYWQKGEEDTKVSLKLTVEIQGKTYPMDSTDTFMISSQSGLESVISEFVIRDWRPGLADTPAIPALANVAELKLAFEGTADGVTQKAEGVFPVSELSPASGEKAPGKGSAKGQPR